MGLRAGVGAYGARHTGTCAMPFEAPPGMPAQDPGDTAFLRALPKIQPSGPYPDVGRP